MIYEVCAMKNIALIFFIFVFHVRLSVSASLLSATVNVIETGSYLQYIKEDVNITACSITFGNETFALDLHTVKNAVAVSKDSHNFVSRTLSLGQGFCGYKFYNASLIDLDHGLLTITDDDDKNYGESFKINIYEMDGPLEITKEVVLGTRSSITCGREVQSQEFCNVYNPTGQLVSSDVRCYHDIPTVSISDVGTWRCVSGILQSMVTINYKVELKIIDYRSVHSWITEEKDFISIGCKLVNYTAYSPPSYCEMINPDGQSFVIHSGSALPRYTTLKTDLNNFTCAVEIQKPVLNSENGLWKCRIGDLGTVFTVGNTKAKRATPKRHLVPTLLDKPFSIICQVLYAATYCHISAPNGTRYKPDKPPAVSLGECSLEVNRAQQSDNGTWSCSFLRENAMIEEVILVEVLIGEVMGYIKIIETQKGKAAELSCHTGTLPLQYCRFISPTGIAYHLQKGQSTGGVAYSGRGIEYGDCGIKILSVQQQDLGDWTCVLRVGKDYLNPESSGTILLFQDPSIFSETHLATTLDVTFVLCGLVGFFVYRRWKKRRRDLNESDERIVFHRSSNERIFNTTASDYNAVQGSSNVQIQCEATSPSVYRRGKKHKRNRERNEERGAPTNADFSTSLSSSL